MSIVLSWYYKGNTTHSMLGTWHLKKELTLSVTDQIQLQPLALHGHQYQQQKDPSSTLQGFLQKPTPFHKFQAPLILVGRIPSRAGDVLRQKGLRNKSSRSKGVRQ